MPRKRRILTRVVRPKEEKTAEDGAIGGASSLALSPPCEAPDAPVFMFGDLVRYYSRCCSLNVE